VSGDVALSSRLELEYLAMNLAIGEFVDFLATNIEPHAIIAFAPSEQLKARIAELIHLKKASGLSEAQESELGHCLEAEHLMRLLKARARSEKPTRPLSRVPSGRRLNWKAP